MIRRILISTIAAVSVFLSIDSSAANISGPVRGVWFQYVNTTAEDFDWVLDQINQADPSSSNPQIASWTPNYSAQVVSEIQNMLSAYQAAGVNYISIAISPRFIINYCQAQNRLSDETSYCYDPGYASPQLVYAYPQINPRLVMAVENFLDITNSGPFAGKFKIELVVNPLSTQASSGGAWTWVCESGGAGDTNNSGYSPACGDTGDANPNSQYFPIFDHSYGNAEEYIYSWLTNVITDNPGNNIGMVLLGMQWHICVDNVCDGDSGDTTLVINNGEALKAIWAWEQSTFSSSFPGLIASYETIGTYENEVPNAVAQMENIVRWATANTSNLPYLVATMYIRENPGSAPVVYANDAGAQLVAFEAAEVEYHTKVPLWVQEFGGIVGKYPDGYDAGDTYTAQDQENAVNGIMLGMNCEEPGSYGNYPQFVWVTGYDYNPNNPDMGTYGLIDGFTNNMPTIEPGWQTLNQWYNDANTVSGISISAPTYSATSAMLPGTCPTNYGDGLHFTITTEPVNGSVSVTDTHTGTFTYTPNNYFWGTDSFGYQWSTGSPTTTVNVTVYSVPVMTVLTNTIL